MDQNELQHWGILNMKWGIRRFQNPDGSLTEEGRKRYGVGPARKKIAPEELSDDDLYAISKRTRNLANYYNSQNDYIRALSYNKELVKPKKKTSQFLTKVLINPIENFLSKSIEFGLYTSGEMFLDSIDSKNANRYLDYVLRNNQKGNNKKQNNPNKPNISYNQNRDRDDNGDDDDDDD